MKKINKLIAIILVLGLFSPITTLALSKKETIYTTIDYNGKVNKTIINNHLYQPNKGKVEDETELNNILNINGDETFKLDGNKLTWNSTGKDIFYRGDSSKELPLAIKTSYYLNGKEVNPKKIVGKKGNIEIRLKFINNSYSKEDNMYLPLVVTVGTIFNDKENYNIEISNGKAVDTGTKTMAVGIASPGLYENTGISEFNNFDNITINYNTTNFKLSNVYIIATPKVLESKDLSIFNKIDSLYNAVDKLNSSMDQIDNGAKELLNGTKSLKDGTNKLSNGLYSAKEGSNKLESGSKEIDGGLIQIINELNNSSSSDMSGLITLKQSNTEAISNLTTTNTNIASQVPVDITMSEEDFINTIASFDAATKEKLISYKKTYDGNNRLIYLLTSNNNAINSVLNTFNETSTKMSKLKEGLMKLEYGTNKLSNGLNEFNNGMNELYKGSNTLDDGTSKLVDGTNTLSNGISKFNTEGIKKIVDYSNKFKVYTTKAKKVLNKSNSYRGFGSNNVTRTTFVFKMKSIK